MNANEEKYVERMRQLAFGSVKLDEGTVKNSDLIKFKKAGDGYYYGIVKEQSHYYIKKALSEGTPDLTDFTYIGGLANKLEERHKSFSLAEQRLNIKVNLINEAYGMPENMITESQKQDVADEPAEEGDTAEEMPTDDTASQQEEAPAEEETPGEEAPVEDTPEEEVPAEEEAPAEEDASEEEVPAEEAPVADEDEINSALGKFTAMIRHEEMTPAMVKNIMNSVISSLDFSELDKEDLKKLSRRITTGGEKIEEEVEMEVNESEGEEALNLYELEDVDALDIPEEEPESDDTEDNIQPVAGHAPNTIVTPGPETAPAVESTSDDKQYNLHLKDNGIELSIQKEGEERLRNLIRETLKKRK